MDGLKTIIAGSAITNAIFALLWGLGRWLATIINVSKCESDNSCFHCETALTHLETIRETNVVQLERLKDLQVKHHGPQTIPLPPLVMRVLKKFRKIREMVNSEPNLFVNSKDKPMSSNSFGSVKLSQSCTENVPVSTTFGRVT